MISCIMVSRRPSSLAVIALFLLAVPRAAFAQLEDLCPSPVAECSILCASTLFQWADCPAEGGPPPFDEPLASDRPDFTEASTTVGRGVRQLEMGYTYFRDEVGNSVTSAHSYPEFLLRVGVVADWLEMRVGWNYGSVREQFRPLTRTTNGAEDLYLGLKLGLTPQNGLLPEMALVPQMTVPTGHTSFSAHQVLPGMNWLYGWEINDWLSTAGSTQVNLAVDSAAGDEYVEFAQSWTVGYTLTEKLGAYTEWFVISPAGSETARTEHYLDGGFAYRVTNDLQLDIRAGKGLSGSATDYFVGTGMVIRW
jgi:Putative MetA-pathway of phenol degradation